MTIHPLSAEEAAEIRRRLGLPERPVLTDDERRALAEEQVRAAVPFVRRAWAAMLAEAAAAQDKAS